jgi:plastocyanin
MRKKWSVFAVSAAVVSSLLVVSVASTDAGAAVKIKKVSIPTFAFQPKFVKIHKGVRVKWTNTSGFLHHILFTNGVTFSKDVPDGSSVGKTFFKIGKFHYHCTIHPSMTGTVRVIA